VLTNDLWRGWLAEEPRRACTGLEIALWAYVFRPDHVHLLVKPLRQSYDLALLLKTAVRSPWSRTEHTEFTENWPTFFLRVLCVLRAKQKSTGAHAVEKAHYCDWNPVTRRLVRSPAAWRWSSYRWLELGRREGEPLRMDEWDEPALARDPDPKTGAEHGPKER
jgi:REP element-mobilizing transposase RayT